MNCVKFEPSAEIAKVAEAVRSRMGWIFAAIRTNAFLGNGTMNRGQYQYSGVIEGKDPRSYEERVQIVKKREVGRSLLRSLS